MDLTMLFGMSIGQTIHAIPLWETLFIRIPTVSRIIEFGSHNGGFSCYLKLCAMRFWVPLYSFDIRPFEKTKLTDALSLEGSFSQCDILAAEDHISGLIKHPGRTILYCDNGNKPAEFRMYAKHLKVGDVIGAHDWTTEIRDEDVAEAIEENNLHHIPLGENLERESFTKFFVRAAAGPRKDAVAAPEGVEWKTAPMRVG